MFSRRRSKIFKKKFNKNTLFLLQLFAIAAVLGLLVLALIRTTGSLGTGSRGIERPPPPSGVIYLSLAPLEPAGDPSRENELYALPLRSGAFDQLPHLEKIGDGVDNYAGRISPDGSRLAFFSASPDNLALMVSSRPFENAETLYMPTDLALARSPSWSKEGDKIAFMGRTTLEGNLTRPEGWNIYVYDLASMSVRLLTSGTQPHFLSTGDLLVLKDDGLHLVDPTVEPASETLVWEATEEDDVYDGMKTSVSHDERTVVWSAPGIGELALMSVDSWEPFQMSDEEIERLPVHAFWSVFSPNDQYLAFQEVGWEEGPTDSRLVILNLKTKERVYEFDLSSYAGEALFLDDWE